MTVNLSHIPATTQPYVSTVDIIRKKLELVFRSWGAPGELLAIKCHFGERGATRYLRPLYVRAVADAARNAGMKPFATDTVVLYKGSRSTAVGYLETASAHGFTADSIGCPLIISDGMRGEFGVALPPVNGGPAYMGAGSLQGVRHMAVLSHITLHGFTGVAGAIKNVGMGLMSSAGKAAIHGATKPLMDTSKCSACGECLKTCGHGALELVDGAIRRLDTACTGCCHCMGPCRQGVYSLDDGQLENFSHRLTEAAAAFLAGRRSVFINGVVDVTPQCDCASFTHAPVYTDAGFVIAADPFMADRASVELMEREKPLESGVWKLWSNQMASGEKFFGMKEIVWETITN
ncbi:MAG: DUF362 domain-containing protein [Nitrospinae bacterium]|nr:DUF362 domain-containing protein [Nitrospinota bacterium]